MRIVTISAAALLSSLLKCAAQDMFIPSRQLRGPANDSVLTNSSQSQVKTKGCCRFGGECGGCGSKGKGWCHRSLANCEKCKGDFDPNGKTPTCSGPAPRPTPPTPPPPVDACGSGNPPAHPSPVPTDGIICPVLATGVHQGHLNPDSDGNLTQEQWEPFLRRLGASDTFIAGQLQRGGDLVRPLRIYEMNGKAQLEHAVSTGIRDPVKNRSRMDVLLKYANSDGVFTQAEFAAAGCWFESHSHVESHEVSDEAFNLGGFFSTLFLPFFGRCGEKYRQVAPTMPGGKGSLGNVTSHYPARPNNLANARDPLPCTPEMLYMRQDDVENIMWRNRFPDDFQLF